MRKKEETLFLYGEKFDAKKAKEYFDELSGESPRATAILGHTYLENLLKELLHGIERFSHLIDQSWLISKHVPLY